MKYRKKVLYCRAFILLWMLIPCHHLFAKGKFNTPKDPPETVIQEFYSGYLQAMKDNSLKQFPSPIVEKYVCGNLIKEIQKDLKNPDSIGADYFIRAQDYFDEWLTNIQISRPQIKGQTASAKLILGNSPQNHHFISVYLCLEKGNWRIQKVTD